MSRPVGNAPGMQGGQNPRRGWLRRSAWEGPSRPALKLFHPELRRRHFQELLKLTGVLTALIHTGSGRL